MSDRYRHRGQVPSPRDAFMSDDSGGGHPEDFLAPGAVNRDIDDWEPRERKEFEALVNPRGRDLPNRMPTRGSRSTPPATRASPDELSATQRTRSLSRGETLDVDYAVVSRLARIQKQLEGGDGDLSDGEDKVFLYFPSEGAPISWSEAHAKLVYLISLYARAPSGWLRHLPLNVLIYECVCSGAIDWDYAPASEIVSSGGTSRRLWLNISQEGLSALDDLRECGIISSLKLSTTDFQPVTAYQVSTSGIEFVSQLPQNLKSEVDDVCFGQHVSRLINSDTMVNAREDLAVLGTCPHILYAEMTEKLGSPSRNSVQSLLSVRFIGPKFAFCYVPDEQKGLHAGTDTKSLPRMCAECKLINQAEAKEQRFRQKQVPPTDWPDGMGGENEKEEEEEDRKCPFILPDSDGVVVYKWSSVTEIEDLSYVSSPFIVNSLFKDENVVMTSNKDRAEEAMQGTAQIRDELEEANVLANVHILVTEWIPFGPNQIVALSERLGALDRCQGGMFTAQVDENPTDTDFSIPPDLTKVKIIDFDFVKFINFEADVAFPEEGGVVQIENFGMHLAIDGTVLYGMRMESIMNRLDQDISVDMLSRVLVDLQSDSSTMMEDLLSQYQRDMLRMLFCGDQEQRQKVNVILATAFVDPVATKEQGKTVIEHPRAEDLINPRHPRSTELRQILGPLVDAFEIDNEHVVVLGRLGMLFCGPRVMELNEVIVHYAFLLVRDLFVRHFFLRSFILNDALNRIRSLILNYKKNPHYIKRIRSSLNECSRDLILAEEMLTYCRDSMRSFANSHLNGYAFLQRHKLKQKKTRAVRRRRVRACVDQRARNSERRARGEKVPRSDRQFEWRGTEFDISLEQLAAMEAREKKEEEELDVLRAKLVRVLDLRGLSSNLQIRVMDLFKLLEGSKNQLGTLQQMQSTINTGQLEQVFKDVEANTRTLVAASGAQQRASTSLEVMQVILAGSFAFDIVDRLGGGTLNLAPPDWVEDFADVLIEPPGLWFVVNIGWLVLCSYLLLKLMAFLAARAKGEVTIKCTPNIRISIQHMEKFVESKVLETKEQMGALMKAEWVETDPAEWHGASPKCEVLYDTSGFLLSVMVKFNTNKTKKSAGDLLRMVSQTMEDAGALLEPFPDQSFDVGSV